MPGHNVFNAISQHLVSRATDIARFAATGYSFEEWLNWEAFLACKAAGFEVKTKPCYSSFGLADCRDYADLLVVGPEGSVFLEIGLVHDWTGKKWSNKLDHDGRKVCRIMQPDVVPMQVIVVASTKAISNNDKWACWLKAPLSWDEPPHFHVATALPPAGEMVMQAWCRRPG